MEYAMSGGDAEAIAAASIAAALVIKARAHVTVSLKHLNSRLQRASATSPHGVDRAAAKAGTHKLAYQARVQHAESASNALDMHLRGLEAITRERVFYPLPAVAIVRAIAETVASCIWLLRPADPHLRVARAYAASFKDLDLTIASGLDNVERFVALRETLIATVGAAGAHIQRKVRDGQPLKEVDVVRVGRATAKVGFSYRQRVSEQIPSIGDTYSGMSGVVHGTQMVVATALDDPAVFARLIAAVTLKSVDAWSVAVHAWVGATPAPYYTDAEYDLLVQTIPQALRDDFAAR